ncbi:MAG: tetratricopeptide repeat protein, partial [Planctomycetia bacterium]|nr:tetratricopeptide repeat protein [Planctomycetia bacterium]
EPRVRIELAKRYLAMKDYEKVDKVLGTAFLKSRPTIPELNEGWYLLARSLHARGKLKEAISVIEKIKEHSATQETNKWREELKAKKK